MRQAIDGRGYALFEAATRRDDIRVVSVDIFDTLLLRTTRPESARFLDVGRIHADIVRKMGGAFSARDLLLLRLMAARAGYRNAAPVEQIREPRYADIVEVIAQACRIRGADGLAERFAAAELAYESSMLTPNRRLVGILQRAKASGKRVICISDMYFGAEHLHRLVAGKGIDFIDATYSSADFGVGKASRRLFDEVLKREGVAASQMVHCGDNAHSDHRQAIAAGLLAFHVPRSAHWRALERWRHRLFRWKFELGAL